MHISTWVQCMLPNIWCPFLIRQKQSRLPKPWIVPITYRCYAKNRLMLTTKYMCRLQSFSGYYSRHSWDVSSIGYDVHVQIQHLLRSGRTDHITVKQTAEWQVIWDYMRKPMVNNIFSMHFKLKHQVLIQVINEDIPIVHNKKIIPLTLNWIQI